MKITQAVWKTFGLCFLLMMPAACSDNASPSTEITRQDGGSGSILDGSSQHTSDGNTSQPQIDGNASQPQADGNTSQPQTDGGTTPIPENGSPKDAGGNPKDTGGNPKDAGGNPPLPQAGKVYTTVLGQPPNKLSTVCEYGNAWRLHSQHGQNASVVPQRQYVTSCRNAKGRHLFVSLPVYDGSKRSQYVYEALLNESTGKYTLTGNALHMGQCQDASGLAASPDCSFIGVLCHRAYGDSKKEKVDADLITPYAGKSDSERGWVLRGDNAANKSTNTEMWLYEFPGAKLSAKPKTFLVHKAVRASDRARGLGQYYLKYGPSLNSYGMAVRSSMFTKSGSRHVADAFLIIKRGGAPSTWSIDPKKGYPWGCGRGHTDINHPGFNPISKQFAIACRTDVGGGLFFRTDKMGDPKAFHNVRRGGNMITGGPTTFASLPDGGFMLALVGNPKEELQEKDWPKGPPTRIGLARFSASGALTGKIHWIVSSKTHFLGHAQIANLGKGRYLLGWSEQWKIGEGLSDKVSMWLIRRRHSFQSAWAYYVMEIDANGKPLTQKRHIKGAGWGDFDEWTQMGDGRIGWSYIANPELIAWNKTPPCNSKATPALFLYKSSAP